MLLLTPKKTAFQCCFIDCYKYKKLNNMDLQVLTHKEGRDTLLIDRTGDGEIRIRTKRDDEDNSEFHLTKEDVNLLVAFINNET